MWAGTMLMMMAAAAPQEREPEHSDARRPRNHDAVTPNHAGIRQHTSLSVMYGLPPLPAKSGRNGASLDPPGRE